MAEGRRLSIIAESKDFIIAGSNVAGRETIVSSRHSVDSEGTVESTGPGTLGSQEATSNNSSSSVSEWTF